MSSYWGYHLILDCKSCNKAKIQDGKQIAAFVKHLVKAIDMKAYGEPIIEHFATHDPTKGGYSLVQLIETSAISGHFVDENGDVYLDIFSCKEFSIETVKEIVNEYFAPEKIKTIYLTRQA
jgi:S-adenosylmethionine/arginine decarboxylase-like enzyme